MAISTEALQEAQRLTQAGRLMEATRLIQAALGGKPLIADEPANEASVYPAVDEVEDVIDIEARVVPYEEAQVETPPTPVPVARQEAAFTSGHFVFGAQRYRYRVYVPARAEAGALLPVVVMLHGCKQNSEDFARGTGMNALAEREQVIVLYPEQVRKANSMGCWNWFEPAHQGRDAGEPAMIAALARQTAQVHGGDPSRIYVAGLSAGAAMATLLGELHPDVFAAVGAHSGLPPGAAQDMPSAFSAMRRGVPPARPRQSIPTIVFHGTSDSTVHASNGDSIAAGQVAAWTAAGSPLAKSSTQEQGAGRAAVRTRWTDAQGSTKLEVWTVEAGPHAWSGGQAAGSFTDPQGPDASKAMLAFFLQHRRAI